MYIGQIPVIIDQNAPPLSPIFCLNMERLEETVMAAITKKEETAKSARVDKAMDSMKKPEKQAGTLRHISIRPAENGYTVGVEREPDADDAPKGKGDMPVSSYTPPKDSVFGGKTAKQDVLDHISKHLD